MARRLGANLGSCFLGIAQAALLLERQNASIIIGRHTGLCLRHRTAGADALRAINSVFK